MNSIFAPKHILRSISDELLHSNLISGLKFKALDKLGFTVIPVTPKSSSLRSFSMQSNFRQFLIYCLKNNLFIGHTIEDYNKINNAISSTQNEVKMFAYGNPKKGLFVFHADSIFKLSNEEFKRRLALGMLAYYEKTTFIVLYRPVIPKNHFNNIRAIMSDKNQDYLINDDYNQSRSTNVLDKNEQPITIANSNISIDTTNNVITVNKSSVTTRPTNTVHYRDIEKINAHIKSFVGGVSIYNVLSIKHKTGILACGTPGTGKSTLPLYIAGLLPRGGRTPNIYTLSPEVIQYGNISDILHILAQDGAGSTKIVVIEEFEKYSATFTEKDIAKFNELFDSPSSPNDCIFVILTNSLDLPPVLTRSGRVNLKLKFENFTEEEAIEYLEAFPINTKEDITKILKQTSRTPDGSIVPADIQQKFLEHQALKELEKIEQQNPTTTSPLEI